MTDLDGQEPTCLTPGAIYHIKVDPGSVRIEVVWPQPLELGEDEARLLESELHRAVESVLAAAPDTELALLRANKEVLIRRIISLEEFARDIATREDTERPDELQPLPNPIDYHGGGEPELIAVGQIWVSRGGERFEVVNGTPGGLWGLVMLSDPEPRRERAHEESYMRRHMTREQGSGA